MMFWGSNTLPMTFVEKSKDLPHENVIPLPSRMLEISRGVAKGDEEAAREFFEMFADRLFRFLIVVSRGDEEMAREALSNTMVKAVRSIRPLATEEDAWRWLTRIARNCFVDLCRKKKRCVETDEISVNVAAPQADRCLESALNESVNELPAEEQKMVEQFYFEEESQLEIAAEKYISRKAVESKLARIRQKLRAAILRKLE
jgi:RNA polymerase sigma-70 factor, ECF subfamily